MELLNLAFNRSGTRLAIAWGNTWGVTAPRMADRGAPTRLDRITVHETATGATLRMITLPPNTGLSWKTPLALSPDGRLVATTGPRFEVRLYPVEGDDTPVVLGTLDNHLGAIDFHPDGRSLAACGKRFAAIWDVKSRAELVRIHSADRGIWDIAYSPDGRYLATASDDAVGRIWDSESGRELAAIPGKTRVGLSVAFSPRGDRFAVGGASASVIAIEGGRERRTETAETNTTGDLVFHPIQRVLFHSGGNCKLYTWPLDKDAARIAWSYRANLHASVLKIAPEGRELIAGFQKHFQSPPESDYSLRIISPEAPTAERLLKGPKDSVYTIALDARGRRIAASSDDGGLYVWDFKAGTLLFRKQIAITARSLHFLDDSRLLVATSNRLLLLSSDNGAIHQELQVPGEVAAFVVTPDSKEALIGATDGAVHRVLLPNLAIKQSLMSLDPPQRVEREGARRPTTTLKMAISPDGSLLAATTQNQTRVALLDSRTLKPIAYLPGVEGGSLNFLVFDPKGKYLAFGDVHVRLWDLAVVRDELAAMGLAWDQPKHASLSATSRASGGD